MKIAVYTSFAINYFAKARALAASLHRFAPHIDLYGLVCDDAEHEALRQADGFKDIWFVHEYPHERIHQWIFKHNIMELSTAGKGWALGRLLDAGYDYVFYLDPDCWVFEDLGVLIDVLPEGKSVSVVPHTLHPADSDDELQIVELSSLKHGIFNLGYLLVKNDENGRSFAKWWSERLHENCTDDFSRGLFTDQRWIDLAVGYFDFIDICRHPGVDVATWNVRHRAIQRVGEYSYTVDGEALIFYHFSGVGPNSVHRWVRERLFPDDVMAADLELRYEQEIERHGQSELASVPPKYSFFGDGMKIEAEMRLAYWRDEALRSRFPNPYEGSVAAELRQALKSATSGSKVKDFGNSVRPLKVHQPSLPALSDLVARRLLCAETVERQLGQSFASKRKAWKAYCKTSWTGELEPNPVFDTAFYLWQAGAVNVKKYKSPLNHFVSEGLHNGMRPSIAFDEQFYLLHNPDVSKLVRKGYFYCGYEHFVLHGLKEGRRGSGLFDERAYLEANPDVKAAVEAGRYVSGAHHYWQCGAMERRRRA
jgi:hypothetical protein